MSKIKPRFAFTLGDLIILKAAGRVVLKRLPKEHKTRKELKTAIRRAAAIVRYR